MRDDHHFKGATPEKLARALLRPTREKKQSEKRSRSERQTPATPA